MRPRRLLASLGLAAATAALAASCSDSTGPGSVNGRYTLRLVEGQPLPVLARETRNAEQQSTFREYIDGGTLVLLEPERDTLRLSWRFVATPDGGSPTTVSAMQEVPYYLDEDRMCPTDMAGWYDLNPGCEGRPTVPRRGDSLFIELPVYPASQPLTLSTFTFVRVGR